MISLAASDTLHTKRANAVPSDYKFVAARGEHIAQLQNFVPTPSDRPSYDFKFRLFTLRFDYKRRATLRVSTAELTAARAADGGLPRPARRRPGRGRRPPESPRAPRPPASCTGSA